MTVWCTFADEAAFRMFHDTACADLGIPFAGSNAATGEPDPFAQWTTAYVDPWVVGLAREIMAEVADEDVATYRLTPAKDPPVWSAIDEPAGEIADPYPPDWDWHQPIPPEYLEPPPPIEV